MTLCIQEHVLWLQVTVYNVVLVQVLDGQQNLLRVEPAATLAEPCGSRQMEEQLATRAVLQNKVQLLGRLECINHIHNERVGHRFENVSLRLGMLNLVSLDDVFFTQHLHCVHCIILKA